MTFWEKITGNDMTKEMKAFEARIHKLPNAYQETWEEIKANLWPCSDLTGRNLMPVLDDVLGLLEEAAAEGLTPQDALGDNIKEFCDGLMDPKGAKTFRDKWRVQLNNNIAKKLDK